MIAQREICKSCCLLSFGSLPTPSLFCQPFPVLSLCMRWRLAVRVGFRNSSCHSREWMRPAVHNVRVGVSRCSSEVHVVNYKESKQRRPMLVLMVTRTCKRCVTSAGQAGGNWDDVRSPGAEAHRSGGGRRGAQGNNASFEKGLATEDT